MGYLNDLINSGRLKSPSPLAGLAQPKPPASISRPAPSPAAPAPTYYAPPAPAYQEPAYQAPAYQAPAFDGGSISQPGNVAPAPAPPQKSPADISKMAEVDSTFMDQKSMYANALKKYIEDYSRQKKNLELDASTAQTGISRNREVGLTGLSEDFASRGLANSGMFAENLDKADTQYDKQKENVTTGLTNSIGDLDFRKSKYEAENGANGTNVQAARREAYARLAAAQNLT